MIGRLALLLVLTVGWVSAQAYKHGYQNEFTADNEFLLKQKRVYQILYHFTQPEIKTELYKEGQEYNIEANLDSYTNKVNQSFNAPRIISNILTIFSF
jgi:hypothetical protein